MLLSALASSSLVLMAGRRWGTVTTAEIHERPIERPSTGRPFFPVRHARGLQSATPCHWRSSILVLILAAGCVPGHPGDDRRIVRIGDTEWTVLVAGDDGMRGRDGFDGADGMLFDLGEDVDPGSVVFVMDGVRFPLDIAWFSDAGALVGIASMAVCPEEPCPTYAAPGAYRWAIEAAPGAFDGLDPGDRLEIGPSGAGG